MDLFKNFVYNTHNISDEAFNEFKNATELVSFKRGHLFVKQGQVAKYFYIIKSGVARAYLIDRNGKERTRTLYTSGTTGNLNSLITKTPSNLIYECLTDCEFIQCNYEAFNKLTMKYPDLLIFHYKILEKIYLREESKVLDLILLDATERYKKLKERIPRIDNLINQYHIASYLNITPVQLSRIKKSLLY